MASVTSAEVQRASGPNGAAEGPTLGSAPDTMMLTVEVRAPVHLMRFLAELRREAHLSLLRVECDRKELVQIRLRVSEPLGLRDSLFEVEGTRIVDFCTLAPLGGGAEDGRPTAEAPASTQL